VKYTLGQAAIAVGKSKATISKAIKSGRISADKQDNGSYKIDPSELHRVYPPTPSLTVEDKPLETPSSTGLTVREIIELQVKLKASEQRQDDLKQRIGELEDDREHWRTQATRLLTNADNRSFWKRMFG